MLKKWILWSLYAAFLGLLLAGAAYRTSVKQADRELTGNQSSGELIAREQAEQQEASPHEWIEVYGTVISVSEGSLSIALIDGRSLEISRRAWRYARERGFIAQAGERLKLDGFYEDGSFEVGILTNLISTQSVTLRDTSGHPLWSGSR